MLILNADHIKNSLSILDALKAVEEAFLTQEKGGFIMPDRMHVEHQGNVLLVMPAFGGEFISTKLVSVFPENTKKDIPSIFGAVILSDGESGKPLALLEGSTLTALRTGAVGGLATAYTTPKNITKLGLAGAGTQGFHQALFAATVRNITQITVFDPFKKEMMSSQGNCKNCCRTYKYLPPKTSPNVFGTQKSSSLPQRPKHLLFPMSLNYLRENTLSVWALTNLR